MHKIGVDIGASLMKMVEYDTNSIINKSIKDNKEVLSNFEQFIKENKINLNNIEEICVTGVNSSRFLKENYNTKVKFVDEFIATSKGALKISNKDKAIIASVRNWYGFY